MTDLLPPSSEPAPGAPAKASFSERVVSRVADVLGGRRDSRRGFLTKTAVIGSALAVQPWDFITKPASAYDVVCGEGNTCADGWSVFCCTINGTNSCPPGSFTAGWWKADASGFCCGAARYYIDCNAVCGSGWTCHCNDKTCDQRLVACNQFRYGQCHQEIACYGPVVCRVVTCTPPWQYDHTCTTASATDNRTVSHSAPCLPGNCPSPIAQLYADLGGPGGALGPIVQTERPGPGSSGRYALYARGAIYQTAAGVHEVHGAIWTKYQGMNTVHSSLGFPRRNTGTASDGVTRFSDFEKGSIYATKVAGTREVHGAIADRWYFMGRERSILGLPVADTATAPDGKGRYSKFQGGSIYYTAATGPHEVCGAIRTEWLAKGGPTGFLGYPITGQRTPSDGKGRYNDFQHGTVYWRSDLGAHEVHGPIFSRWEFIGRERSILGYPIEDQRTSTDGVGRFSNFRGGSIYWSPATGPHEVCGSIRDKWTVKGRETGFLGYPTTGQRTLSDGAGRFNDFQGGSIYWGPSDGRLRAARAHPHQVVGDRRRGQQRRLPHLRRRPHLGRPRTGLVPVRHAHLRPRHRRRHRHHHLRTAMHVPLVPVAALVAVVAAIRSLWSPCGLSMLSTITPVSERSRQHRYGVTASWFVLGAVVGGATLGVGAAALAAVVHLLGLPGGARAGLAVAGALVAIASDIRLFGFRLPRRARQVDETWLGTYRPWFYGAGFGWQIGTGLATYVMTAGVYLTILLAALTGQPFVAFALCVLFGATRGLAVLVGAGATTPARLRRIHQRLDQLEPASRAVAVGAEGVAGAACAAALWGAPAALVVAAVGVAGVAQVLRGGGAVRLQRPLAGRPAEVAATPR